MQMHNHWREASQQELRGGTEEDRIEGRGASKALIPMIDQVSGGAQSIRRECELILVMIAHHIEHTSKSEHTREVGIAAIPETSSRQGPPVPTSWSAKEALS